MAPTPDSFDSSTLAYYRENALQYAALTQGAVLPGLQERFLALLSPGDRVLDAGCGAGRDLRLFRQRGFQATGVDASAELLLLAAEYSGAPCFQSTFRELTYHECFEGVWACASLLHLPKSEMAAALARLREALVPGGVLGVSLKDGTEEVRASDGRFFAYYRRPELEVLIAAAGFFVTQAWSDEGSLPGAPVLWHNVLATAGPGSSALAVPPKRL